MLLTVALLVTLHVPAADSVAGAWRIKGDVQGNPVTEVCTIQQAGNVLTGRCDDPDGGEPSLIAGKIENGTITFWHGGDWDGQELTIVYTASLASPKELKGTIEVRPMHMTGTFTATLAPAEPAVASKP